MNSKITIHRVGSYLIVHHYGLHFGWICCAFCSSDLLHTVFYSCQTVGFVQSHHTRFSSKKNYFKFLNCFKALESGQVGLAILTSISLMGTCQWGMRQCAELENQMTSVERIVEYANIPPEPAMESNEKNAPPSDWPQFGNIEFKSLSLRYAENAQQVLRNLTFRIDAKVRIILKTVVNFDEAVPLIFDRFFFSFRKKWVLWVALVLAKVQ